jgi:hypothetical protein
LEDEDIGDIKYKRLIVSNKSKLIYIYLNIILVQKLKLTGLSPFKYVNYYFFLYFFNVGLNSHNKLGLGMNFLGWFSRPR